MFTDPIFERRAREQREASAREEAEQARKAAIAEETAKRVAASHFDAEARALPNSMFADDPEIKALRARLEVAQRQRPVVSLAIVEPLNRVLDDLSARIKAGALEMVIAAIEGVMTGDPLIRRAMALQAQLEDDTRRQEVLAKAKERICLHGLAGVMKNREQIARLALEDALLERKRQHLRDLAAAPAREHPETLDRARGEINKSEQEVTTVVPADVVEL